MPPSGGNAASQATLLFEDIPMELASTRRMIERYPNGKGTWKPDPKSRSLGELTSHIVNVVSLGASVLEDDELEESTRPGLPDEDSATAFLTRFDRSAARIAAGLQHADSTTLQRPWRLLVHGNVVVQGPRRMMLRMAFMSHLIHHRAQLATYYRLLGVPVPGMYGPSADDREG